MGHIGEEADQAIGRFDRLNEGERDCLRLVAQGLVSKEIARHLDLSPHTVDDRIRTACRKLRVRRRSQAAHLLASLEGIVIKGENYDTSKLRYEESGMEEAAGTGEERVSAGEGSGSDDLEHQRSASAESRSDSASRRSRLVVHHPYAIFFGGRNRQPIILRLLYFALIVIGIGLAYGGIANGLTELSRILAVPKDHRP